MNENIDLTKILKNCPKGTKFYSSVYGELIYSGMYADSSNSKIYLIDQNSRSIIDGSPLVIDYYRDGRLYTTKGECTLFPSKEQRDWSKFERFWDKPKIERFDPKTLKPFDKVVVRYYKKHRWECGLFSSIDSNCDEFRFKCVGCCYDFCIPYNDETKHLVGTTEEAPEYYRYWEDDKS